MTVTVVVADVDAREMTFGVMQNRIGTVGQIRYGLNWIVNDTPLVCDNGCARFDGSVPGHVYASNWPWVTCQTCRGTTRACVEIIGEEMFAGPGPLTTRIQNPHGYVTVDTGILIQNSNPNAIGTIWDRGDGTYWLIENSGRSDEPPTGLPVTFGGQDATPGRYAHEIIR